MENPDVWLQVLKRVPADELGECLCVCKTWCSIIMSPTFISSHALLSQSNSQNQFLLRIADSRGTSDIFHLCSAVEDDTQLEQTFQFNTLKSCPNPFNKNKGDFAVRVLGTVNGIICISDYLSGLAYSLVLWNPLIRKCVKLPEPPNSVFGPTYPALGFGYDVEALDYKVVRLLYPKARGGLDKLSPLVDVYSLKEGVWRRVIEKISYFIPEISWSQCFLRGSVHWVVSDKGMEDGIFPISNSLLLFNVNKEKFETMALPPSLSDVCPEILGVSDFQGLISVQYFPQMENRGQTNVDLWIKKVYNENESWSKVLTIDCANDFMKVLHWRPNGKILAWGDGKLMSYDPDTKVAMPLDCTDTLMNYHAYSYSKGLVFLEEDSRASSEPKGLEEDITEYSTEPEVLEEDSSACSFDSDSDSDSEPEVETREPFMSVVIRFPLPTEFLQGRTMRPGNANVVEEDETDSEDESNEQSGLEVLD